MNRQRTYFGRLTAGLTVGAALVLVACSAAQSAPPVAGSPPPSPDPGHPPTAPGPPAGATGPYVFPVNGHAEYGRTHHDYPATDIIAACDTSAVAVTDGIVLEVSRVDRFDPADPEGALKGGLSVSIMGTDGVRYYGSHLSRIAAGIDPGIHVRAGTQLGLVGRTGNANICHLHFGISPVCQRTGDWWNRRGVIWPWPYLDAWRTGTQASPVAEVTEWQRLHGCPTGPGGP